MYKEEYRLCLAKGDGEVIESWAITHDIDLPDAEEIDATIRLIETPADNADYRRDFDR